MINIFPYVAHKYKYSVLSNNRTWTPIFSKKILPIRAYTVLIKICTLINFRLCRGKNLAIYLLWLQGWGACFKPNLLLENCIIFSTKECQHYTLSTRPVRLFIFASLSSCTVIREIRVLNLGFLYYFSFVTLIQAIGAFLLKIAKQWVALIKL